MSKIIKPSFALGYWRPLDEQTSFWDSYQLYIRETSLARYNAEIVGSFIEKTSDKSLKAIRETATHLGYKIDETNKHLNEISFGVRSMVYGLRIQIEQQKATNMLLHDIKELLRLPDIERERIYAIELGLKFFSKAQLDAELFSDALIEFQKAEKIMNQDYFVLHKIGLIYLLVSEHLDVPKALEYFKKAARYASVENDHEIRTLAYLNNDHAYDEINSNANDIGQNEINIMASESYERAAFCAYVLGEIIEAISLQTKAIKLNPSAQNYYFLGKYQIRNGSNTQGIESLNKSVEILPEILELIIKDFDLNTNSNVINWINLKVETINDNIRNLQIQWKNSKSADNKAIFGELEHSFSLNYAERVNLCKRLTYEINEYNTSEEKARNELISVLKKTINHDFFSIDANLKSQMLTKLNDAVSNGSAEEMKNLCKTTNKLIENDLVKRSRFNYNEAQVQKKEEEKQKANRFWFLFILIWFLFSLFLSKVGDLPLWGTLLGSLFFFIYIAIKGLFK